MKFSSELKIATKNTTLVAKNRNQRCEVSFFASFTWRRLGVAFVIYHKPEKKGVFLTTHFSFPDVFEARIKKRVSSLLFMVSKNDDIWLILPVVICLFQGLSHASPRVTVLTGDLQTAH